MSNEIDVALNGLENMVESVNKCAFHKPSYKQLLQNQIHFINLLINDIGDQEEEFNKLFFQSEKHGIKIVLNHYIITDPSTSTDKFTKTAVLGWTIMLTSNGKTTIEKKGSFKEVLTYIKKEVLS